MAHNHLRDLPEVICELISLEKIECGDNRVRSVPRSVSKLTRLALLSLKNNNLRNLPSALGACEALKSLSLNANDLIEIPDALCHLQNLKRLTLAANNLQSLPERMGDMASLQTLDLSSNPIVHLPASLGMLNDSLHKVELFECAALVDPPPSIIRAGHGRMMVRKLLFHADLHSIQHSIGYLNVAGLSPKALAWFLHHEDGPYGTVHGTNRF